LTAKAEIIANHEIAKLQGVHQDLFDKGLREHLSEGLIKSQNQEVIDWKLRQAIHFFPKPHEPWWGMVWIKELSGLGFKKDDTNGKLKALTFPSKSLDDPAVA
jgi:hypothetical protein